MLQTLHGRNTSSFPLLGGVDGNRRTLITEEKNMAKKKQSPSSKAYFSALKASGKKHKRKTPKKKGGWITAEMRLAYTPSGDARKKGRVAGVTTREEAQLQRLFKANKTSGYQPPTAPVRGKRVGSFGALLQEVLGAK
jgi:hypothetical protein